MSTVRDALRDFGVDPARPVHVACSGGADSIALADICFELRRSGELSDVDLIHVDHQLHPGSAVIAQQVAGFARGGGAECRLRTVNVDRGKASLESAARDARYAAFEQVLDEAGGVVLLAHTASDQAETVLMRIIRGTGLRGLAGIPPRRGSYRRPLLGVWRQEVEAWVSERGLKIFEDPTNADLSFFRNRVRHRILPTLCAENPQLAPALVRLASSASSPAEAVEFAASELLVKAAKEGGLCCAIMERAPETVLVATVGMAAVRAGLGPLAATHLEGLCRLVQGRPRGTITIDLPGGPAVREYDLLTFGDQILPASEIAVGDGFNIRPWQPGDRIRLPRLRGGSKKVADLYIDYKVPRRARERARVVVRNSDGEVVWAEHVGGAAGNPGSVSLTSPDTVAIRKS